MYDYKTLLAISKAWTAKSSNQRASPLLSLTLAFSQTLKKDLHTPKGFSSSHNSIIGVWKNTKMLLHEALDLNIRRGKIVQVFYIDPTDPAPPRL
jgi:hypothetical protein